MMPAAVLTISAGDLGDQAVADGETGVGERVGGRQPLLGHPDDESADQVDGGDDQAGDGVAADELGRAVHRAVEIGVALPSSSRRRRASVSSISPAPRSASIAHLLARHRVEGEAGGHLGDAAGALGDHHEVDHDQDQEDHQPDDDSCRRSPKLPNASMTSPAYPSAQDQPGAADVEPEPEQREQEQEAREDAELERVARPEA
jgi:hypothetical protein